MCSLKLLFLNLLSVVKTWINILEKHCTDIRHLKQKRLEDELIVSLNAPEVVEEEEYWKNAKKREDGDGHIVRQVRKE